MLHGWLILLVSFTYLGLLFAIAYYGDKRADQRRSLIGNPYIYALSLAVYCTAWTFYGSVGRAASTGVGFLPIYLGPTLMFALGWLVLRKIVRISKAQHLTSIADFVSSRYGKSTLLSGLVTVIAVVGIMPYIALQLKAVSTSFTVLLEHPMAPVPGAAAPVPVLGDTVFWVAMLLAAFAILFGTRHIDATEHHEGMVAAIAFESVVKLIAFLAVGVFVTYGLYNGFGDLFTRTAAAPELEQLFTMGNTLPASSWVALTVLSMFAILFLPRQFQVAVVENVNEAHVGKAMWLLPLYLLLINLFVLPIAFAGLLHFPAGTVDPDTFVLALPLVAGQDALALFVFIGGLSAATGMVIVESIALSTMISNDLVMPVLLRIRRLRLAERGDVSGVLLGIRRVAILLLLLLGYTYFRLTGEAYALVSIGLISFAAVAQFAPVMLGGIFWKGASRRGAFAGLIGGFAAWVYTLLLPSFARSGWISLDFLERGPLGIEFLRPTALFGLTIFDDLTHGVFWSLLLNVGAYVGISLLGRQSVLEYSQAALFVDVFRPTAEGAPSSVWRGTALVSDLRALLARFLGPVRADEAFAAYARQRALDWTRDREADAEMVAFAEKLLAGAIGAASARVLVSTVVQEEPIRLEEVMHILDETQQVIAYSRELEKKSQELEAATRELKAANERLQELDRMKDEFISTVTHELRTPLTSIRAFSEILHDNPELDAEQRIHFLGIVIRESERLTRLINQVLDLEKIESGRVEWHIEPVDVREAIGDCLAATEQLFRERGIRFEVEALPALPPVRADRDRLLQVLTNLVSNAVKFSPREQGRVWIRAHPHDHTVQVDVQDNGPGIRPEDQPVIFEKFGQVSSPATGKPEGTGLGLPISRRIVEHLGGKLWVDSTPGQGATFSFSLPTAREEESGRRKEVETPAGGEVRDAAAATEMGRALHEPDRP
jgi:Na+/proline symporter/nitrogen-specific signal transduction histidine kinase